MPGLSLTVLVALAGVAPPPADFSPHRRVVLESSRVVGWPDPPPPYRTRRVFERHAFRAPVYLTSHPAHDLVFVVEQAGRIVHLPPSGMRAPQPFVEVKDADTYGMTFHPDYRRNGLVYVFANGPNSQRRRRNQIVRYRAVGDPPRCDPASRHLVLDWESNGHNGGDLAFGPDGMLYVSSGDGTSDSDIDLTGQDLRDLCSGILRLDVDRPAPGRGYAVPADNPFRAVAGARPELWAFGLRNPWRMCFTPAGDLLVGDVGQDRAEMIRLVRRGSNHGWSVQEGSGPFQPLRQKGPGPIVAPLVEHPHSESRSITGGLVYQGKRLPGLRDVYVYGDYSTGKVWGVKVQGGQVVWKGDLALSRLQLVGFGADPAGELYLVDHGGQIHVLDPSPPEKAPSSFPRRLTESGLFSDVRGHRLHPALIPYHVNAPLWSDGSHKERAIALPGSESIGFTDSGAWQFPDRTVLVKTFALELADGTRRRVETRFLTRQQGEWYGYSYAWSDDERDAVLVGAAGMDRTYRLAGGRELSWRYPSRIECMVCHTRAAGFVLGLSTAQMNREHDYGTSRLNQLTALQRLGVLRVPATSHLQDVQERLRPFTRLATEALAHPGLAPLQTCCLEPAGKRLQAAVVRETESLRRRLEKQPAVARLPRDPAEYPRLVDPDDAAAPLEARVRSYLQGNCAHCHVEAGGGNAAINLHFTATREGMKVLGAKPLHDTFGLRDAAVVSPGAPDRSVLLHRLAHRGRGQMPPLGSQVVDDQAVRLVRQWIASLR